MVEEKDSTLFRKFAVINVTLSGRDRLWFRLASNSTEKIYGAGEQFTYLNLKGREFPMWIREQGKLFPFLKIKIVIRQMYCYCYNLIEVQVLEETYPVLLHR